MGHANRFDAGKAAWFAIAVFALRCDGEFSAPGPGSNAGAAMGGSAGTRGEGGDAGSDVAGRGGRGGSASLDAGPDGAAASSAGGSSPLPAGCPTPAPVPVPDQTIAIRSINVETSEIVLTNPTSTDQSIRLGRQAWQWCAYPRYWSLDDEIRTVVLAPGETYAFVAVNNQSGTPELYADEGEMAIYDRPGVFEEPEYMQAFVAWGDIQAIRESYAVQKGIWTFDERIEIEPGHAGFIATGPTDRAAGYTSVRAACLVAPPNP